MSHSDMKTILRELTMTELRAVDGDTFTAWVQVYPELRMLWRIRVRGIECGELDTAHGQAAKTFLQLKLNTFAIRGCWFVGTKTERDQHGRHVGDIQNSDGEFLSNSLLLSPQYWHRNRSGTVGREKEPLANPTDQA